MFYFKRSPIKPIISNVNIKELTSLKLLFHAKRLNLPGLNSKTANWLTDISITKGNMTINDLYCVVAVEQGSISATYSPSKSTNCLWFSYRGLKVNRKMKP